MALLMVMTLSLLVYFFAGQWIRVALSSQELTVRNQVIKQISNPTLRWVFILFGDSMYGQDTLPDGETYWYSQINQVSNTTIP
jgi:hypothetical protein